MRIRGQRAHAAAVGAFRRAPLGLAALITLLCLAPLLAQAAESSSANYTSRAGHFSSGGSALLSSTAGLPRFLGSGTAIGHPTGGTFFGSTTDLTSNLPGYWPIVVGAFPLLDLDGDGLQAFFDADDDGDGLGDVVETNTGLFVSGSDTGSDPYLADSDGDGFGDFQEVANMTDPNDEFSFPNLAVPGLGLLGILVLIAVMAWSGKRRVRGAA